MAAKVNSKFVFILAAVLFVLFVGVAGLAYVSVSRSGERFVKKGDEFMAQGKIKEAAGYYERAVGKPGGRANKVWLTKWREALDKHIPEDQLDYEKQLNFYVGILAALGEVEPSNPDPQIEYIRELMTQVRSTGAQAEAMQTVIEATTRAAERLEESDPKTQWIIGMRGLAQLERIRRGVATESEIASALEDLKSASKANPNDWEVNLGLVGWHNLAAERAANAGRGPDSDAARKEAIAVIDAFLAANPNQPEALLQRFAMRRADALRKTATAADRVAAIQPLRADGAAVLEQLLKTEPADIRSSLLQFVRVIIPLDAELGKKYVQLCERSLSADPKDPERLILLGQALDAGGDAEGAIARFQQVAELPAIPVSLRGMMLPLYRRMATGLQVDTMVGQWDRVADAGQRAEVLKRAKQYRDNLAKLVDVRSENMLARRDATIALLEGRNDIALAKLSDLRAGEGADDPDVLLPLAEALYRMGNPGEARRIYERLYRDGFTNPSLMLRLGDLYTDLQLLPDARAMYTELLNVDPSNQVVKERLARVDAFESGGTAGTGGDEVFTALVRAADLQTKGKLAEARKLVEDTYAKHPSDRRPLEALLRLDMAENKREDALARVRAALAKAPEDAALKRWESFFAESDPVKSMLNMVEASDLPPAGKAMERYSVYMNFGKFEEAKKAFAEAEKLAPDEPRIIEIGFLTALQDGDFERARGYATRAAEKNLDQLSGLTFQGRMELAQGKHREAMATFKKATDRIPERPELWRFYGQAQSLTGDIEGALKSFERAMTGRPNDVMIAKDYVRALATVGRLGDALRVISPETGVLRFGGDDEAYNMWLDLEARAGSRSLAIEKRRIVYQRNPKNVSNALMLADLLIDQPDENGENEIEARTIIEAARALPDVPAMTLVQMEARLLAAAGNLDGASAKFRAYVDSVPEDKRTFDMYAAWARFMANRDRHQDAETILAEGRKHQSPERREADRQLGDLYFDRFMAGSAAAIAMRNREQTTIAAEYEKRAREFLEKARDAYKAAADAGAESRADGFAVSKRLAEVYSRMGEHTLTEGVVQSIINRVPTEEREKFAKDREILLLRAQFAIDAGDRRLARQYYDEAVELYPTDPQPFLRRGVFLESEPNDAGFNDAIADLDRVHTLRPGLLEAWGLRFEWYRKRGRVDEAYTQLRKGITANAGNNELKQFLIARLENEGRMEDALAEAIRFADADPSDLFWQRRAAELAYQRGAWAPAQTLWARVYAEDDKPLPDGTLPEVPVSAIYYLDSLVRRTDRAPDPKIVNPVLQRVESIPQQSPRLLMLRARAMNALGDEKAARALARQGYEAAGSDSRQLMQWFFDLSSTAQGKTWGNELLAEIEKSAALPPMLRIARFQALHGKKTPAEQVAELAKLHKDIPADDRLARLEMARLGCRLTYALQYFEDAARYAREGVDISPTDGELNNNLAYLMVKHLNKPQEALPYAMKSAEVNSTNSAALDTLGLVHLQLNQLREAEEVLRRAVRTAQNPEEALSAAMHLSEAYLKLGDKANAQKSYKAASEAFEKAVPTIQSIYKADLESLGKAVQ